jgi:hypothetical protein
VSEYLGESEEQLAQLRSAQQTIIAKPISRLKSKRIAAIFCRFRPCIARRIWLMRLF